MADLQMILKLSNDYCPSLKLKADGKLKSLELSRRYRSYSMLIPKGHRSNTLVQQLDLKPYDNKGQEKEMNKVEAILKHRDEVYPLLKLYVAKKIAGNQIARGSHWEFCYSILSKVSRSFFLAIQQLDPELRNAACVYYLIGRALDTVEDDTSIPTELKVPLLKYFHHYVYERDWKFSCGKDEDKVLLDQFHHVSTAFLELKRSYQELIKEAIMEVGEGMSKFICKEIETIDEYDEYCYHVNGNALFVYSKIIHASGSETFIPGSHWHSMGNLFQKANIIEDYLVDINEKPQPRMFWPREIWSKYVKSLEEFKYEENSDEAVQCLNEMVTNALGDVEGCLKYMSSVSNPRVLKFWAIPQIMAMGTLALCYGNTEVFRGKVKLRQGLTAKIINETETMADVYGAFYDFSSSLKSKVDMNDPSAKTTMSRIEAIQKICRDSGSVDERFLKIISYPRNLTDYKSIQDIYDGLIQEKEMSNLVENLIHPDELYALFKLRMAEKKVKNLISQEPHWGFCHSILPKVSQSFSLLIRQLDPEIRDAATILYLMIRAIDTVEDDTSVATEVKVPILEDFHRHMYDPDWHFSCGVDRYKVLMDSFHHVSTSFLELESSYQKIIEETLKEMGAGMAKFICQKVETIDDYNEYCHYVAGLLGSGYSKLFQASGLEVFFPDYSLSYSMGLFLQKANIIQDYLEDINEIPKPRMFWPAQIWRKYVNKIEDLKCEENSDKALQCLNEMVTDALIHVEDCLRFMAVLRNPSVFRYWAIPQIVAIGTLALCYNNSGFFKDEVKMRIGLKAKIHEQTRTMADVYGAFFDFSSVMKSKVDKKDHSATTILSRIEAIQKICRESGTLNERKRYMI